MASLITVHNAGPDEAIVLIGGTMRCRIPAGHDISMSVARPVKFENVPPLTRRELAEHMGIPELQVDNNEPGRYASEEM